MVEGVTGLLCGVCTDGIGSVGAFMGFVFWHRNSFVSISMAKTTKTSTCKS